MYTGGGWYTYLSYATVSLSIVVLIADFSKRNAYFTISYMSPCTIIFLTNRNGDVAYQSNCDTTSSQQNSRGNCETARLCWYEMVAATSSLITSSAAAT